MSDYLRRTLLRGMSDIVTDLYGTPAPAPAKNAATAPAAAPAAAALPPFSTLWRTADESIDWTDALASPTPTDGLTPPKTWSRYHALAEGVLHGDVAAYLDALEFANPMADLTPYVAALDVETVSADVVRAIYTARKDLLQSDERSYLCGMAVRIARDLFAAIPVTEAEVRAVSAGKTLLSVRFTRAQMNKVRFAFVDPVWFVAECGGVFPEE